MKKKLEIYMLLSMFIFNNFSFAQNLVPNPSFEDTISCPTTGSQIYRATGWENCGISPDYFNSCNGGLLGTPLNAYGNQIPVEGQAYAGLACNLSTVANIREFLGRPLSQPLIIGQNYYVSFYVSLADAMYGDCAINNLGIKFSTVAYDSSSPPILNNFAHVFISTIVSDKINWTKISGSFIADSSYTYFIIGNFFDDAHTDTLNCPTTSGTESYYYLDMVCISEDAHYCETDPEEVPEVSLSKTEIISFPNPVDRVLVISSLNKIEGISIYSVDGKLLYSEFGKTRNIQLPVTNLSNGIYLINIYSGNQVFNSKILVYHK